MNEIVYRTDAPITAEVLSDLFVRSGIRRPTGDLERLGRMIEHANLIVTAWDDEILVGIARSLTDFSYSSYLSDLAVDAAYQHQGIGKELVRRTKDAVGDESMLLLLSAPTAIDYYPKIGMEEVANGFIINRIR